MLVQCTKNNRGTWMQLNLPTQYTFDNTHQLFERTFFHQEAIHSHKKCDVCVISLYSEKKRLSSLETSAPNDNLTPVFMKC